MKILLVWFQLSVVFGSLNSGVGSLACGVNVASWKFSSLKYSPFVIISSLKSSLNSGMSLIVQNLWWARNNNNDNNSNNNNNNNNNNNDK